MIEHYSQKFNQTVQIEPKNDLCIFHYDYENKHYIEEIPFNYEKLKETTWMLSAMIDDFIDKTQSQVILDRMWEEAKNEAFLRGEAHGI